MESLNVPEFLESNLVYFFRMSHFHIHESFQRAQPSLI
jgi:hypothetical protein